MRHTTARHHPHTPTQPRKEKTGKEGEDGRTGGGPRTTKHQHRNPLEPDNPGPKKLHIILDARVHYAVHNQPAHTPPHNFLEEGVFGPGRTAPEPDSVPRPAPTETTLGNPLERR